MTFAASASSLGGVASLRVVCAKGRNAKLKGRKQQQAGSPPKKEPAEPKQQGLKYNKRGKVSTQPGGQISKAQFKKIQQATAEAKVRAEELEEKV